MKYYEKIKALLPVAEVMLLALEVMLLSIEALPLQIEVLLLSDSLMAGASLEIVGYADLPGVILGLEGIDNGGLGGIPDVDFACLAAGYVVVGFDLDFVEHAEAYTDVDGEVAGAPRPFVGTEVLALGEVEAELGTCEGEEFDDADVEAVAHIDGDADGAGGDTL